MSRRAPRSQAVVERLIEERRRYAEWLQRLAVPGAAGASSPVVDRVRADYQTRLDNVTRQLAQHEGELETVLAEAELRRDQADGQRAARQDALAEAVLRHQVGEYDEEKFASLSAEHASFLAQLAEDVEAANRDIARVEDILAHIARVLPEPVAPPGGADAPAATASPADAAALGRVAAHIGGLDELSFLRSVAEGPRSAPVAPAAPPPEPPAARPAATTPAAHAEPPLAAPPPEPVRPEPAPEPARDVAPPPQAERVSEARKVDLPLPSPVEHIVPEVHEPKPPARPARRVSTTTADLADEVARKTLKCLECSTLNFPTEWYCEKCGAELSAF